MSPSKFISVDTGDEAGEVGGDFPGFSAGLGVPLALGAICRAVGAFPHVQHDGRAGPQRLIRGTMVAPRNPIGDPLGVSRYPTIPENERKESGPEPPPTRKLEIPAVLN